MSGRFVRLKKNWMLRGWTDAPLSVATYSNGGSHIPLTNKGFYVASACDGNTDFNSIAFLPEHHQILDEMAAQGIVEQCGKGDSLELYQQYKLAANPYLGGIHWCITGKCNLNCRHCSMESPSGRYGELPAETLFGFIDQFERANVLYVALSGGEPFLRHDFLEIVDKLAEKHIWLSEVYSNGLLIRDHHLEGIKKAGFHPVFQISFDGKDAHDLMRGTMGIEQKVIGIIRKLRNAGFRVVVSTCTDRLNIDRMEDTYELVKDLDIQAWRIGSPQRLGRWKETTTALTLDEEAAASARILERWIHDERPFHLQLSCFFRTHPNHTGKKEKTKNQQPNVQSNFRTRSKKISRGQENGIPDAVTLADTSVNPLFSPESYNCYACREQSNLLPDGTLIPCPGFVDNDMLERMPNLLFQDLSSAWSSSFLRDIIDMKKKDVLAMNPECAECELFPQCGAGCRVTALTDSGDLMAKDLVICELWKRDYKNRFREFSASPDFPPCISDTPFVSGD